MLTTPGMAVDADYMQDSASSMAEDVEYVYQRANGTVERATSIEDAMNRCPVLGKMAVEQAVMVAELAAVGKKKMADEAEEEPEEPELEPVAELGVKPELKPKAAESIKSDRQAVGSTSVQQSGPVFSPAEHTDAEIHHVAEPSSSSANVEVVVADKKVEVIQQVEQPEKTISNHVEAVESADAGQSDTIVRSKQIDTEIPRQQQTEAEPKIIENTAQPQPIPAAENRALEETIPEKIAPNVENDDASDAVAKLNEMVEPPIEMPSIEASLAKVEDDHTDESYEIEEPNESPQILVKGDEVVAMESEQEAEIEIDVQLEQSFDSEVMETYEQLTALGIARSDTLGSLEIEDTAVEAPELTTDTEVVDTSDFEALVAVQPAEGEPIALEVIQEQADEQPLEQTLLQLVEHLSGSVEAQGQDALREAIYEVEAALPACYATGETGEIKLQVTPEMIEKLLILLRALGYQHPSEALLRFVAKYDVAFLLQALEYICRLDNDINRQNTLIASSAADTTDDDSARLRLGKLLFRFVTKATLEPST